MSGIPSITPKINVLVSARTCRITTRHLPTAARDGDNHGMPEKNQDSQRDSGARPSIREPFAPGAIVVATLGNPRDKFWGMILALAPEGISMIAVELASFEDFVLMIKDAEPFSPAIAFFPMHRIERIELDLPDGNLPSLSERFFAKTGIDAATLLNRLSNSVNKPGEGPA